MGDVVDTLECVTIDDRRDRDRDPLLARTLALAGQAPASVTLDPFVTVVVDDADVRLVAQQAVERGGSPLRLAARRRDPAVAQLKRDLPHRPAPLNVGVDDLGLGLVDLDPRSSAVGIDNAAVAVGALPERDLAGAGAVELAATVALGDLGLLVLGDHSLHLDQQCRLRIVARCRALQEVNGDPEALQFLEDQDLVGVGARETIDTQTQHALEHARLGRVAQAVKRVAIQPRTRVPIVDELVDHLMPVSCGGRA